GRHDAHVALEFHERLRVELLRVHDSRVHVGEDTKLVRDTQIVTVRRYAVADYAFAYLRACKWLDHFVFERHTAEPLGRLHRHSGPPRASIRKYSGHKRLA